MKRYPFPYGQMVDENGVPTVSGKAYLQAIQDLTQAIAEVENLDGGTTYTADDLRDKIIEILSALQG